MLKLSSRHQGQLPVLIKPHSICSSSKALLPDDPTKLGAEQPEAVVLEPAEDLHRQARAGQARRQDQSNDDDGDDGDDEAAGIRTNS